MKKGRKLKNEKMLIKKRRCRYNGIIRRRTEGDRADWRGRQKGRRIGK
jgi:hypothetical protein